MHNVILVVTFIVFLVVFYTNYMINKKYKKIILNISKMIKNLNNLNKAYDFYQISSKYADTQYLNSKRQYDRADEENFKALIFSRFDYFQQLKMNLEYNISSYTAYNSEYSSLPHKNNHAELNGQKFFNKRYIKVEKSLYKKNKVNPITEISYKFFLRYISPAGRNSYLKHYEYNSYELCNLIANVDFEIKNRQTAEYKKKAERAKMSDSLRYDILKRDGFKCKICGHGASDNVKLHVDHIYPISKGGLTIANNLRTLCDQCNLGKRDKVEVS